MVGKDLYVETATAKKGYINPSISSSSIRIKK